MIDLNANLIKKNNFKIKVWNQNICFFLILSSSLMFAHMMALKTYKVVNFRVHRIS